MYDIMNIPISEKRALLIGINYLKTPNARLYGCINDIVNVKNMLAGKFGYNSSNITVLRDDDILAMPTRDNIMRQLYAIAASSTDSTETWVHYSGHGSQMFDTDGDEKDRIDETIVPCDYPTRGTISDDELFTAISRMKGRVLLFFDSCHSATVCDLQYSREYRGGEFIKTVNNSKRIENPNIIMMSGSKDNQTSADTYNPVTKQAVGAFTDKLVAAFSTAPENMDLLKVYNTICFTLSLAGYTQLPIFSTTSDRVQYLYGCKMDLGPNVFGILPPPPPPVKPAVSVVNTQVKPSGPVKPAAAIQPSKPAKIQMPFSMFQSFFAKPAAKPANKKSFMMNSIVVSSPPQEYRKDKLYFTNKKQSRVSRSIFGRMDHIIRVGEP